MVATASTMQSLGSPAPAFTLPAVNRGDQSVSLDDFEGKPLLVMFICNHCPYVVHVMERLAELGNQAQRNGFGVVAISANDVENYPQDGPGAMAVFAEQYEFDFVYCYDEPQSVAKAYGAACTPDFYVFDEHHLLRYRGQMDGARPGNGVAVTGEDLQAAIEAVGAGQGVSDNQVPSMGCNIKWKAGNEPEYF